MPELQAELNHATNMRATVMLIMLVSEAGGIRPKTIIPGRPCGA